MSDDLQPKRKKALHPLNAQQTKLLEEMLTHGVKAKAKRAAGYSVKQTDKKLPKNVEHALTKVREEAKELAIYTANHAMEEAAQAIQFAIKTNNANAYVKAVELRSKLKGLLVEKHEVRNSSFSLVIQGFAKKKKEDEEQEEEEQEAIDSTCETVEEGMVSVEEETVSKEKLDDLLS